MTTDDMPRLVPSLKRQAKLREIKKERIRSELEYSLLVDKLYAKERREFQEREFKLHAPHPNNVRQWRPRRTRMNEVCKYNFIMLISYGIFIGYSDRQARRAQKRPRQKPPAKKLAAAKEPENEVAIPIEQAQKLSANEPPKKKKKKTLEKKTSGLNPLLTIFEEQPIVDCQIQAGGLKFHCKVIEGPLPSTTKVTPIAKDEDQTVHGSRRREPPADAIPKTSSLTSSADSPGRRKKMQMLAMAVKNKKVCKKV